MTCANEGVRNVCFSENFAHVLNEWSHRRLTYLTPMSYFYTPWNVKKTRAFVTFSGDTEMGHRCKTVIVSLLADFEQVLSNSYELATGCWNFSYHRLWLLGHLRLKSKIPEELNSCSANQWAGFYMIGTYIMKELSLPLREPDLFQIHNFYFQF